MLQAISEFSFLKTKSYFIVCIYHIFFILIFQWTSGFSNLLTVVNNAAKTWLCKYVFKILLSVSFSVCSRTEIAGLYSNSVFNCLNEISILFSIVLALFYLFSNSAQSLYILYILTTHYFLWWWVFLFVCFCSCLVFFDRGPANRCEMVCHCGF